ncbi:MAG: PAS domain-containing sensor histidine kinase [Gemmatirosa sp.]
MTHLTTPTPAMPGVSGSLRPGDAPASGGPPHPEATSEQVMLEAVVRLASDAIIGTDAEQRILLFNRGAEEMFGWAAAEAIGRPLEVLLPERFAVRHRTDHVPGFGRGGSEARRMAERRVVHGRRRDGEEFPAEVAIARCVVDGQLRFSAIVRDVSEGHRREAAIRDSERRYRTLVEAAHDGIVVCDADDRIRFANPAFATMCGRPVEGLVGIDVAALVAPEELAHAPLRGSELERAGGRLRAERTLVRPDGTRLTVEVGVTLLGAGEIQCLVHDVTERRRLEEELRGSERRFRGIFDSAFQFIGLLTPDGTVLEANLGALTFAGVTADAVVGRPFWDTPFWAHSPAGQERLRDAIAAAAKGAFVRYEAEHVGADGQVIAVDFSLKPVRGADGRVALLIPEGRDITEAKRTAALLRESEETFRSAFEHSGIGLGLVGLDGRWQRVNRALCRILGYEQSELLALTFQEVTHPEDLPVDLELVQQLMDGARESYELEKRYLRKDGQIVWALMDRSVVRSPDGAPRFFIAQVQDITARRMLDVALQRQRENLARSNAELEQFAYVASHDLKEPLRAIASYTQLLHERYAEQLDDRARKYIGYAVEGATRMGALIDDLLALSRVGTAVRPFELVDLDAVLRQTLQGMAITVAEAAGTVTSDPLPTVRGDAAQLRQVLQNLIGNALKFRRPGVAPRVHLSATSDADRWTIAVRDNGIGIEARFADRVFVIFRRLHTREEFPGTGIGLAICRKVVERHGGEIWVEPAPDAGSTFRFTLPRDDRRTQEER